ncbi:MAG: DNA primase [Proteobacteria bacterium]|nr:DNA primase [Pseudomonadota bacterium]
MIEQKILQGITFNDEYSRKVIPFLKEEYFHDKATKTVYNIISDYIEKYNKLPSVSALLIDSDSVSGVSENDMSEVKQIISNLKEEAIDIDWLVDNTEQFCKDKAVHNAIMESIQVMSGKSKLDKGSIPQLLSDALGVSFDSSVGHNFIEDWEKRYDFYHTKEVRIPFDLEYFNAITKGGLPRKTLNIALAGTGVGKSLFMCHCAAGNFMQGLNVLYITMEMAEEKIAERIDANLLNEPVEMLEVLPKDVYEKKINRVKDKSHGRLIIKEYPTAGAGSGHFRHLMKDLKIKNNFTPDIVYIDYLNICMSSRLRYGANVNSYTYIKTIAEELRGLAVEFNIPIVSATQTTRSGYSNTDVGLEDTSESFGLPATADFMFALITSDELEALNQIQVKQLKNRYNDPSVNKRFVVGVDRSKMRLYDLEQEAQDLNDSGNNVAVFDKTNFGEESNVRSIDKGIFANFK